MQTPLKYRNDIPFYCEKSSSDFRQDPYERYDPMVIRQSMIHLADHIWRRYPMQAVLDYVISNSSANNLGNILEIGCGVGRCIGYIASQNPASQCWGIDYSYQMLKQAHQIWLKEKDTILTVPNYGFLEDIVIKSKSLSNLNFGLAKCESLPFSDDSQDLIFSSFLLDRLTDPLQGLIEMKRVLSANGKIIIVTPFNFTKSDKWEHLYPPSKFQKVLNNLGLEVLDWNEDIKIHEPIDKRRNEVVWNCIGIVCS